MNIVIKKMETDAEIKGKAYVHWKSWQEAYSGIVDQRYLDSLTLDKCEKIAFRRTDNVIIAKDGDSVIGFVGFGKYRNDELENAGEVFAISDFSVKISIPLENTGVYSVFATSFWPFSLIFSLARRNEGNFFQAVPTTLSSSLAEVRLASLVAWA